MPDPTRWLAPEILHLILDRSETADMLGTSQVNRGWRSVAVSDPRFCLPVVVRLNITDPPDRTAYATAIDTLAGCTQQTLPLALTLQFINLVDDGSADTLYDPSDEIWTRMFSRLSDAILLMKRLILDVNCSPLSAHLMDALCAQPAPLLEEAAFRGAEIRSVKRRLFVPNNLFASSAPRLRYLATDRGITLPDDSTPIPVLQSIRHLAVFGPAGNLALNILTPQLCVLEVRVLPWARPKPRIHAPRSLIELSIGDEEHSIDDAVISKVFEDCHLASLRTLRIEFAYIEEWGANQFSPTPYLAGLPEIFNMSVRRVRPVLSTTFQAAREYKTSDPNLRWSSFEIRFTSDDCGIERVFTTSSERFGIAAFAFDNTIQRVRKLEVGYLNLVAVLKLSLLFPLLEELIISLDVDWDRNLPDCYRTREMCRPYEASQDDVVRCPTLTRLCIRCSIIDDSMSEDMKQCDWHGFIAFVAGELGLGLKESVVQPHLVLNGFKNQEHGDEFDPRVFATVSHI